MKRLAVIPSDPIEAYKKAGINSWLKGYYNPLNFFDEVYCLSPLESKEKEEYGLKVIPTNDVQLKKKLKFFNIDIVRAYGGFWPCDMAVNNKEYNVPVVVSVHDTNPGLLHKSIKKADVVFCVSQVVRNNVLKMSQDENRCWILPNRVDLNVMRHALSSEIESLFLKYPFKYKILHVGRRAPQKNLDTLIKALSILEKDYCVISIGKGTTSSDPYVEMSKAAGVSDRIFFLESVPNQELYLYYSLADCMCTPSRYEGFGIVFIEALACECPVITSNIAPMNEYIKHGINGYLVDEYEDHNALADAISKVCNDKNIIETLRSNSRDSILGFEKNHVDKIEAGYYEKIIAMKNDNQFNRSMIKNLWPF